MSEELDQNDSDAAVNGVESAHVGGAELTERDRQLIGYLSIARYLSTEQVGRLFFGGRTLDYRRRLYRLAALWRRKRGAPGRSGRYENFEPPYLRRNLYRAFSGELHEVWSLTDAGYLVAEHVLRRAIRIPRTDVGAEYLEHATALSELLVGLVDPALGACPGCGGTLVWIPAAAARSAGRPGAEKLHAALDTHVLACGAPTCGRVLRGQTPDAVDLPFSWTTVENTRLPWREYDRKLGQSQERFIQPDAILELGARRYFVECEMGTHSVQGHPGKRGATLAKAERYERFVFGLADPKTGRTFYAEAFPDVLPAELLFLVMTPGRRDTVTAALAGWAKGKRLPCRALLAMEAVRELRPLAAAQVHPAERNRAEPAAAISSDEARALRGFFNEVIGGVKRARAAARASGASVPEYPHGADAVGQLVSRLVTGTRDEPGHSNG